MTSRSNKNKSRKPLETSLGHAPKDPEKVHDLSHLRKPMATSIFGLKQVLSLFQTATHEVQNYITNECDVLYECRICRTIFRSLANFILHKRNYCREKFNPLGDANNAGGFVIQEEVNGISEDSAGSQKIQEPCEEIQTNSQKSLEQVANKNSELCGDLQKEKDRDSRKNTSSPESNSNAKKKAILPIIDKLVRKQEINILAENTLKEDLSTKAENSDDDVVFVAEESNIVLQKIDTSNSAVFQTSIADCSSGIKNNSGLIKSEVMEIHGIFENNEVVLGSNGKICNFETNKKKFKPNIPKQSLVCTVCNFTFSTEKTLTHHIKYKHNKTCIVYPCPDCKETFSNAWSVYRHLYKIHRRTSSQVRRMRAQIHSSGIRKDQEPEKKKDKSHIFDVKENEENQWMNNFEGDKDLQMCGGCGKRFERKAALHSHSQMCTKRIAICNTIKENTIKTKAAENKTKIIDKIEKANGIKGVKGAAKRKPNLLLSQKVTHLESVAEEIINLGNNSDTKSETSEKIEEKSQIPEVNTFEHVAHRFDTDLKIEKRTITSNNNEKTMNLPNSNVEKVSEVISDSDDEKENSVSVIKKQNFESDVTITKHKPEEADDKFTDPLVPEIEIFTISDDSCDSEKKLSDDRRMEKNSSKSLKRKRAASCEVGDTEMKISEDYKEYLNDDADYCFFAKALPYIDKNELKCIPCQTAYLSQYQLLWHMSLHFSWFRFQCSKCSFMSFNKYDCTTHAYMHHGTPNNLMGSTVLPIPKWKVLCSSHNFVELSEEIINNNMIKPLNVDLENQNIPIDEVKSSVDNAGVSKTMPCLEIQENCNINVTNKNEVNIASTSDVIVTNQVKKEADQNNLAVPSEPIVVEDDEMPDICSDIAADTVVLSDDEMKEQSKDIKFQEKAGPSKTSENVIATNRPIRNRTKSVKTVQNDFIYDLAKVLKLNDSSIKNSKLKKNINKPTKE